MFVTGAATSGFLVAEVSFAGLVGIITGTTSAGFLVTEVSFSDLFGVVTTGATSAGFVELALATIATTDGLA